VGASARCRQRRAPVAAPARCVLAVTVPAMWVGGCCACKCATLRGPESSGEVWAAVATRALLCTTQWPGQPLAGQGGLKPSPALLFVRARLLQTQHSSMTRLPPPCCSKSCTPRPNAGALGERRELSRGPLEETARFTQETIGKVKEQAEGGSKTLVTKLQDIGKSIASLIFD
jgi:hypothetical protein